ncbi:MAG TPA: hypothetical protein VEQ59_11095 [Polyangiaceae bacterium]|nr:hypothetical protein [Polyangiaceae bacterium]
MRSLGNLGPTWWCLSFSVLSAGCGGNVTRDAPSVRDDATESEPAPNADGDSGPPIAAVSGSGPTSNGGSAVPPTSGSDDTVDDIYNVPLTPSDGWIDGFGNSLSIQGAVFSFADDTTRLMLTDDFTGQNACIRGLTAKVDAACTPLPPAQDCYGTFFGAAIGLNLKQGRGSGTDGAGSPLVYDASIIRGFSFVITGPNVPSSLRFGIDSDTDAYCVMPVVAGKNSFTLAELREQCWLPQNLHNASEAKQRLVRLSWLVATNTLTQVPFDFCVTDLRAMRSE